MGILNALLGGAINALLFPFRSLHPLVGLTMVSVVAGVAMLLVFKVTSNQKGVTAVKRRIAAGIFEIRLFNDDPRAIVRAQYDILRHTLRYLGLNMVPVLWMIVPLVLVIIQLQFHYGYRGLEPGDVALVKVTFNGAAPPDASDVSLEVDPGIEVESPLLWIPSLREADWRIAVTQPGEHEVRVRIGDEVYSKQVSVSDNIVRRTPVRPSAGFVDQLVYPVERPLPKSARVESITVTYAEAEVGFLFWDMHWIIVFFIISIVAAFLLQKPFKVTL